MLRLLTAITLVTAVVAAPALAAPAHTTREGVASLRRQIDAKRVKAATLYSRSHVIHASESGGKRYSVHFQPAERRSLVDAMLTHHVRFHIVKGASAVKRHGLRRRYIALIIPGGLAVLGLAAFLILGRRRRPPGAVATAAE